MDPKEFYKKKFVLLNTMQITVAALKDNLAELSDHEELAPDPNQGEFYALNTALDEAYEELDYLVTALTPFLT